MYSLVATIGYTRSNRVADAGVSSQNQVYPAEMRPRSGMWWEFGLVIMGYPFWPRGDGRGKLVRELNGSGIGRTYILPHLGFGHPNW